MALVGASYENWQWPTSADHAGRPVEGDDDEAAPVTSRSPSFEGAAPSSPRHREPLESLVVIAEPPQRHESGIMPIVRDVDVWSERQVSLRVAALHLEETACALPEPRGAGAARALVTEASAIEVSLRALVARLGDEAGTLLGHAYEWATNVLTRADAALGGAPACDDLPLDEYSSLFVRAILAPMLDTAMTARTRAKDARGVEDLAALRQSIFFANWAAKRLA